MVGQIILHMQRNIEQGWDSELMGQGSIFSWALREGLTGEAPELITPGRKSTPCRGPKARACLESSLSFKNTFVALLGAVP